MSNVFTRNVNTPSLPKPRKPQFYRLSRWWARHGADLIVLVIVLAFLTGIVFTVRYFLDAHYSHIRGIAALHHYKPGELAYCDHGNDSTDTPGVSWIPCTIIQSNNKDFTSYFVDYGGSQANIQVNYIKQRLK